MSQSRDMTRGGKRFRIGTDIGGTFTDFVAIDDETGSIRLEKTLTTPADPAEAIFVGIDQLQAHGGIRLDDCSTLVHGTTLVINALIERKGLPTALITTAGFRDVLEMRNELRFDVYDLQLEFPPPLVPRALRLEVDERTRSSGQVLREPAERGVRKLADELRSQGIRSVAVCLLNAYANPANEKRVREILNGAAPEIDVSLSSEVLPQIREYERSSTTAANAYVKPLVHAYLDRLVRGMTDRCFDGEFYVMQSGGGVVTREVAQAFPIRILESGPAGGVAAARWWGGQAGLSDLLCFDMGGTTAKLCTVMGGEAPVTDDYEAARTYRGKRGSGLAISVPVFDLLEIGTGGGSIARIDSLGLVKVGPHSAGAVPGPASYGRGGEQPTVTDADVALGFLDPDYFLGGSMALDVQRARQALQKHLAGPLSLSLLDAALGVHELSNEDMAAAARLHLAERGESAEGLAMVAYGGAGPVHAYGLAQRLGIRRVIVPPAAGVMSALGMLVEEPSMDRVRTLRIPLERAQPENIEAACGDMAAEAAGLLGTPLQALRISRFADMRYRGQGYNVRVPLGAPGEGRVQVSRLRALFQDAYSGQYGRTYDDVPIELINLRVIAASRLTRAVRPPPVPAASGDALAACKGRRQAYFGAHHGLVDCPVFDRYRLGSGHHHEGAAFVEERETTIVIWPGGSFEVDPHGMIVVTIGDRERQQ